MIEIFLPPGGEKTVQSRMQLISCGKGTSFLEPLHFRALLEWVFLLFDKNGEKGPLKVGARISQLKIPLILTLKMTFLWLPGGCADGKQGHRQKVEGDPNPT